MARSGRITLSRPSLLKAEFQECRTGRDFARTAARLVPATLETRFSRLVAWLASLGYEFASLQEDSLRFSEKVAYIRYDVHYQDLLAAYVLADLHERLGIPGSFQLLWHYSRHELAHAEHFAALGLFDSRFVQLGLHCAPEMTALISERFGGDHVAAGRHVASRAFAEEVSELARDFATEGPEAPRLAAAQRSIDAHMARLSASFREVFGRQWTTVSAHGNPMNTEFQRLCGARPDLSVLAPWFQAIEVLDDARVARHGFAREVTRVGSDSLGGPRVIFENPIGMVPGWYEQRMAAGAGFVVLFHPATLTGDHFAAFLDSL